ncbi:hypothetical protein HDU97_007148 [Phlyctochytrium planicorne]|nr:hypothetical protein HDU97_007148 [Phlyctochytrium planicorne]
MAPNIGFIIACVIAVTQSFFGAPIFPLIDALVLDLLGDDQDSYGQQRVWAAISCGLTYMITSVCVYAVGSYLMVFALHSVWTVLFLVILLIILSRSKKTRGSGKSEEVTVADEEGNESSVTDFLIQPEHAASVTSPLLANGDQAEPATQELSYGWIVKPNTLVFFLCMAILGSAFAIVQNFLWLFLTEYKGATKLLLGMTGPFTIAVEPPFFFFSKAILRGVGLKNCILIGHFAMLARLLLYTVLPSGNGAWLVLAVELLHGLSFTMMWTAGVRFASAIAPKSMATTAQGLLNGAHFGLGFGVGCIAGGYAYSTYGPVVMFQGSAAALAVSIVLMSLFVISPKIGDDAVEVAGH